MPMSTKPERLPEDLEGCLRILRFRCTFKVAAPLRRAVPALRRVLLREVRACER